MSAPTMIFNGHVLTMDPERPRAQALVIKDGRIVAVGSNAEIRALAGPGADVIDANGGTVLPGFNDAHVHLFVGAAELDHLPLLGVQGMDALRGALLDFAARHPDRAILVGQGAMYDTLDTRMTRHDLDAIIPDRPVILNCADHHAAWANTAALTAAGIIDGRALSAGNEIVMGEDGRATGELREFEAVGLVMALADEDRVTLGLHKGTEPEAPPSAGDRARDADIIANGLAHCARLGITSMTNMDGNRYTLEVLRDLHGQGRLTARVKVPYHHQNWRDPADLDQASALARDFDGDWVSSGFVKAFLDGVGESYTAALLDDYPDRPGWNGELLFSPAAFAALATDVDRRGLQMAVHAVGDRAVQVALDGYQAAALVNGRRDARHRIEHIELISDADIPRLAALGVIASVQPCHVPGAMDFPPVDLAGPTAGFRWKGAYLHRTLAEAGAKMCFASDWPVADANPLRGIQSALERPVLEDGPDDRVTLHDALAAYTSGAAYAEHREDRKGRLSPGFLADIVILDGDIERVATADIGAMGLARTITGGRTVWQA